MVIVEALFKDPRFSIDFGKVNKITTKDSYHLPRVADLMAFLARGKNISTLDLVRGYWQISMAHESCLKTAFITHKGLYELKMMPFGISDAPDTFQ